MNNFSDRNSCVARGLAFATYVSVTKSKGIWWRRSDKMFFMESWNTRNCSKVGSGWLFPAHWCETNTVPSLNSSRIWPKGPFPSAFHVARHNSSVEPLPAALYTSGMVAGGLCLHLGLQRCSMTGQRRCTARVAKWHCPEHSGPVGASHTQVYPNITRFFTTYHQVSPRSTIFTLQ